MKLYIDPKWDLFETFEKSFDAYTGGGITSKGYRNSVLMSWGNMVGKKRALSDFEYYSKKYGGISKLAEEMKLSYSSLRKIHKYFESLPNDSAQISISQPLAYNLGESIDLEENKNYEFKDLHTKSIFKVLPDISLEYIIAFSNSDGGSILFGVTDSGIVTGVDIEKDKRDELRQLINKKAVSITPPINLELLDIVFHPIIAFNKIKPNLYVVEIKVPPTKQISLHCTNSGTCIIRLNGINKRLSTIELQQILIERVRKAPS